MDTKVNAALNPDLANQLAQEAMTVEVQESVGAPPAITIPSLPETSVELPAGYYEGFDGVLDTVAEVRELNGADEEAIAKITDPGKALLAILERATVSVGGKPVTKEVLNNLLAGDREMLILAIRKATFGSEVTVEAICCDGMENIIIDLNKDVPIKTLDDRISDRMFYMDIKPGRIKVFLPTGDTQAKIINSADKNSAELDTLLLTNCVVELNDMPIMSPNTIRNFGIKDRRSILDEIAKRNPGPQLSEIKKVASCGQEVNLPLTLADLFRS
jgi:hypothetical protein